ncbi:HlyD family secretion protein [Rhodobacter viridis]|uniref:Membrane fusion protein (MFP) family protein n=2 Tax=Rhodobacter viridis TaxID=1054202 RepID=A0A318TWR9_9RHOB|nr:HlyD family secretion protein [Rhodobacter viridis]
MSGSESPVQSLYMTHATRALRASVATIFLTFGVFGGWLSIARLDSAVVASGVLENANTTRLIQHLEGGIVSEFHVHNGDTVKAGDLLLRLDPTQSAATADLLTTQLLTDRVQMERLQAEISGGTDLTFSEDIRRRADTNPAVALVVEREKQQFDMHRAEVEKAHELLETYVRQAEEEVHGNEVRRDISNRQANLLRADLQDQKALRLKGLTSQPRVTELERLLLDTEQSIAQSEIDIARIRQAIAGYRLQMVQQEQDFSRRAADQAEALSRDMKTRERDLIIASDSLRRVEVRAPVDGTVQESILGTIGAVIRPGETILKIAPRDDQYVISSEVAPNDIDGVKPGGAALITFPAFQSLKLAPSRGRVLSISKDRIVDAARHASYYEARIVLDEATLPEAQRKDLVAGMTATTIMPTGARSALAYLVGPMLRRLDGAMREK